VPVYQTLEATQCRDSTSWPSDNNPLLATSFISAIFDSSHARSRMPLTTRLWSLRTKLVAETPSPPFASSALIVAFVYQDNIAETRLGGQFVLPNQVSCARGLVDSTQKPGKSPSVFNTQSRSQDYLHQSGGLRSHLSPRLPVLEPTAACFPCFYAVPVGCSPVLWICSCLYWLGLQAHDNP
jgi:hypothetical protein